VKYSVLIVNLLVCIVGAAILAVSLALALSSSFQNDVLDVISDAGGDSSSGWADITQMQVVLYITAGLGGLIFLTGFLGCCGAACENTCLLGMFFVIVLILFLTELGVGIAALVLNGKSNSLEHSFDTFYQTTVINTYASNCANPENDLVKSWSKTQTDLKCCGCNGASDYLTSNPVYPKSCPAACDMTYANVGCCQKIWDTLANNLVIVGGVAIGLLVIELFAMIFTCCLCQAVKSRHSYS